MPWRSWSTDESLDADPDLSAVDLSTVTVLIPARDEAAVIADTLTSLKMQDENIKVVLVDDQSSDETVKIAKQQRLKQLKIVSSKSLPNGWSGKLWALEQGRAVIDSDLILLLDADISLAPYTIHTIKHKLENGQFKLISLMALLRMTSFWEKLLMPAFIYFFKLLYPFRLANSENQYISAAAGGCIMVQRSVLDEIGGFSSIKDKLIDDCALAAKIKHKGGKTWIGLTHSARSQRCYEALQPIWNMVCRTAFTQLNYSLLLLGLCTIIMAITFLFPLLGLFSPNGWAKLLAIVTLIMMYANYLPTIRYYRQHPLILISLPIVGILYLLMTWSSAYHHLSGRGSKWKTRYYSPN